MILQELTLANSIAIYTFSGVSIKKVNHLFESNINIIEHLNLHCGAVQVEWSPMNKTKEGTLVAVKNWDGTGPPPDSRKMESFEHNRAKVKWASTS